MKRQRQQLESLLGKASRTISELSPERDIRKAAGSNSNFPRGTLQGRFPNNLTRDIFERQGGRLPLEPVPGERFEGLSGGRTGATKARQGELSPERYIRKAAVHERHSSSQHSTAGWEIEAESTNAAPIFPPMGT